MDVPHYYNLAKSLIQIDCVCDSDNILPHNISMFKTFISNVNPEAIMKVWFYCWIGWIHTLSTSSQAIQIQIQNQESNKVKLELKTLHKTTFTKFVL